MHTREGGQTGLGGLGFSVSSNIDLWQSRNTFFVLSSIINKHVIPSSLPPTPGMAWNFVFSVYLSVVETIAFNQTDVRGGREQYLLASRCIQINKQAD